MAGGLNIILEKAYNHYTEKDKNTITADLQVEPPDYNGIETAISKLKTGKASGYDQIPAELIKKGGTIRKLLHDLILNI